MTRSRVAGRIQDMFVEDKDSPQGMQHDVHQPNKGLVGRKIYRRSTFLPQTPNFLS